jgi:hypothetical protein
VSHRSGPGSRSAGTVHQHNQIARTLTADRLRAAQDYRLAQEVRGAVSASDASENRGFLRRLVRGERRRSAQAAGAQAPLALPAIARGQVRESEGQS